MVEIVSIIIIIQEYETIFLIHKIQDTVLDLMYHSMLFQNNIYLHCGFWVCKNVCWFVRIYRYSTASITMVVEHFETRTFGSWEESKINVSKCLFICKCYLNV